MVSYPKSVVLEEKWNAYSHGLGILLSVVGFAFFLKKDLHREPFLCTSIIVYSVSLILLFSASTLYHSFQNPKTKRKLRVLDHISIYYLIAGTYTPVCLLLLLNSKGWLLFFMVWGISIVGTILKIFFTGKFETISLLLYGLMGWLIVLDLRALRESIEPENMLWLSLGGMFYTVGMVFYSVKKIPFNHLIWHLFVLGGAISHWVFIEKSFF